MTCLLTLGSTTGYSSPKNYKLLKDKIDEYENSVIKDFSFAVPENYQQNLKEQMKLGILLEEKFTEQKKLFYNAEEGLFKLEDSLEQRIKDGKLTQTEADNLITSVEYARRIILYTRKTEVHSQYSKIREQLIVTPDLENLYKKFTHIKLPGDCKIQNTTLVPEKGLLSFEVSGTDQEGKELTTQYSISQSEIDQGLLTTKYERGEHLGNRDKMILHFNKTNEDESVLSFSLFENKLGEYYHAEFFHDDINKPFINIFGIIKIGSSTIDKEIRCYKNGPRPASTYEQSGFNTKTKRYLE